IWQVNAFKDFIDRSVIYGLFWPDLAVSAAGWPWDRLIGPSVVIQISSLMQIRDVLIVGAGPAGLAAGIAARRLGLEYSIVEKGVLVNSIFKFPVNMVFFTTPELLEIGGMPLVSPYDKPTRIEALRYYRRVAEAFDLQIEFEE